MSLNSDEEKIIIRLRFTEGLSLREIAKIVYGSESKESNVRRFLSTLNQNQKQDVSQQKTVLLSNEDVKNVAGLQGVVSASKVAEDFGIPVSTVKRIWNGVIVQGIAPKNLTDMDDDTRMYYDKLSRSVQKQRDQLRVERKHTRESNRVVTMLEELTTALTDAFDRHDLSELTVSHVSDGSAVGVIQLSDLHFGERIIEISDNVFDTSVIAARLKKFADKAKSYFKSANVTSVLIAMTGDLINSDRRLDEIVGNSTNRADIMFTAVDILQQFILDINKDFNVTIASICGNESRLGKDVGWVNYVASDSFDAMIHNVLTRLFDGADGVKFIPMDDPLECVVNVNGSNILLIHGHNGLANTAKAEVEVSKLKAKYSHRGVFVDYVIFGHIHSAYISDLFARSSGLPGGNAYSDKALNLASRSSQNIYVVSKNKTIDGIKVDLQEFDSNNAYNFNKNAEAYKPMTDSNNTVIIQSVLI